MSKRIDMNTIEIDENLVLLMQRLYGGNYEIYSGELKEGEWKKRLSKLLGTLEEAVQKNVHSDEIHKKRLLNIINLLEDICKVKENTDIAVIEYLINIISDLLGGLPDYREFSKHGIQNSKWAYRLNTKRTLLYTQDNGQKSMLLLEISMYPDYMNRLSHSYDDLLNLWSSMSNKAFIDWFKKEYPEIYLEIF